MNYSALEQFKLNNLNQLKKKIVLNKTFIFYTLKAKNELLVLNFNKKITVDIQPKLLFSIFIKSYKFCISELDLKGVNYWFCFNKGKLLLDFGKSHYKIFYFNKNILLNLKKKKNKKILFIDLESSTHFSISNYFRHKLKPVGPYKLKGFQYSSELITLKEGKKPFK